MQGPAACATKSVAMRQWKKALMNFRFILQAVIALAALCGPSAHAFESVVNSSFSYSARLFSEIDGSFSREASVATGIPTRAKTVNNSAAAQEDLLRSGFRADVISAESDAVIDAMAEKTRKIEPDWKTRFPDQSSPFGTTIVFVVRGGNPMGVEDWEDLRREGLALMFADPAISTVGRYVLLNAITHADRRYGSREPEKQAFLSEMLERRVTPGAGAMAASANFFAKGVGDVLLTYESEALSAIEDYGKDRFQIVYPKTLLLVKFPVAIVDKVVSEKGTADIARAYVDFLYSSKGQEIIAKNNYRPSSAGGLGSQASSRFPALEMTEIASLGEKRLENILALNDAPVLRELIRGRPESVTPGLYE